MIFPPKTNTSVKRGTKCSTKSTKNLHRRFYFIGKTRSKKVFKSSFLAFLFDPTEYLKNDQMVLKIYLLTTIGTGRARIKTPSSAQNPPMS